MYATPHPITPEQLRFGQYTSRDFAPALWQIPRQFHSPRNAWTEVASNLMWQGSNAITRCETKAGIHRDAALLHIGAILHASDMSVEHREAAAGYLLAEWFNAITCAGVSAGLGGSRDAAASLELEL